MTADGLRRDAAMRPRYRRISALSGSVVVTLVTLLGGVGALPVTGTPSYAEARLVAGGETTGEAGAAAEAGASADDTVEALMEARRAQLATGSAMPAGAGPEGAALAGSELALPPRSGKGRRVVFSMSHQRVWLVEADESVARTYPVSGSRFDNLDAGTYDVYSRSEYATGMDGSQLRFMVRFTRGDNAAIGFHNIPRVDGKRVQTRDELGTPLSIGCIRQWADDAKALWRFAPVGTTVVVVD